MTVLPRIVRYLLLALILYIAFTLISNISGNISNKQWDFEIYYYAAMAHQAELDPYSISDLAEISTKKIWLPYVYPPIALQFFKAFTFLNFETAFQLWLILKIVAAVFLVFFWRQFFFRDKSLILFLLFFLLAFDAAVHWDVKTGNISMFEQVFLWCAFMFYMKK